jgi:hypothetical protein
MEHTELASMGGKARALKLGPDKCKKIAKKGGAATKKKWAALKKAADGARL